MFNGALAFCYLSGVLIGSIVSRLLSVAGLCLGIGLVLLVSRYPDPLPGTAVVLFGLSILLGRVLRMIGSDLTEIFGVLGWTGLLRLVAWSGAITLPVAVLAWLGMDFGQMRTNAGLYGCGELEGVFQLEAPIEVTSVKDGGGKGWLLAKVKSEEKAPSSWSAPISSRFCIPTDPLLDVEASLVKSVQQYSENLKSLLLAKVDKWVGKAQERGHTGAEAVTYAVFGADDKNACDGVLPTTIENGKDSPCGVIILTDTCPWYRWFFHIGECAGKEVKHTVQRAIIDAYGNGRERFRKTWEARQQELYVEGQDAGTATIDATVLFLDLYLEPAEADTIDAITSTAHIWRVVSWAIWAWTVAVVLKVFLYVFARLSFAPLGGGLFLSLAPPGQRDRPIARHELVSENSAFKIPLDGVTWYAHCFGVVTWDNRQRFSLFPKPGRMLLKRILRGKFTWMKYVPSETLSDISGHQSHNFPVARVTLPEGARLMVDLGRLEAFTAGVKIRTIFSARLAAFLQRRLFFTEVSGPGSILISGREGNIWAVGGDGGPSAVETQAVIAMDRYGAFGCLTSTDSANLLMTTPTIHPKPDSGSLLIASPPSRGALARFGWLRYIAFFAFG